MKVRFFIFLASFTSAHVFAANTNAPIIMDANATAAYIKDGSSTNRMSPPVPGVRPLRSLTIKSTPNNAANIINSTVRAPQNIERRVASQPATDTTPLAVRVIDKRPLSLTAPTNNPNINSLDEVPLSERRVIKRTGLEPEATLSPAR